MGQSVFPAPSAGKTAYRTTLTSGTSYTVPAGVTYLNVTLGGGGGGCGGLNPTGNGANSATAGGTGGTTTFTGATSAPGGSGSGSISAYPYGNSPYGGQAIAGIANTGKGAQMPFVIAAQTGYFGVGGGAANGQDGAVITSNVSTTPGASITYSIGAGGTAGVGGAEGRNGAAGGSGYIIVEYWV